MTRADVISLVKKGECAVVHYATSRDYKNFILNQSLDEDCNRVDRLGKQPGSNTFVLVIETRVNNQPRAGIVL